VAAHSRLKKRIFIIGHQGLGDHILCSGIYNYQTRSASRVYVFVKSNYVKAVQRLIADEKRVSIIRIPRRKFWIYLKAWKKILKAFRQEILLLGFFGQNYLNAEFRFDENFYLQANVDFSNRWSSFTVSGASGVDLKNVLGIRDEEYIFLHEDRSRGYTIDRKKLPKNIRIIEPLPPSKGWDFFDYIEIIRGATEIHVIESSFAALVESLGIDHVPKFAHRYARPNAFYDKRYEFTYKSDWRILT
jgi:hypothetical protein